MPKIVDHEERRQAIIDAMWRVVERDGGDAVSVRSVAAEAGMSKTGMAHYFSSQNELLALAIEQTIESVTAQAESLDLKNVTLDTATDVLCLMVPDTAARRQRSLVWLSMLMGATRDKDVREVLDNLNKQVRAGIEQLLGGLRLNGLVSARRDLSTEAAILHGIVDGFSLQTLTDEPYLPSSSVRHLIRTQLESLAA